ncbi:DUF421 domain-containing protein [Paenibacillus koleovorans]|uniref:DUF421 domain-containing protein n=1 Tax=Paenibacillus koleovorans TaxID=121608 RepID=UPI000FD729DD|nr:DUF421 domain-containing protein [Paenibacillus koleovorans]
MADWLEVAVRTLVAVSVLFFLTKLLGKRQVSQLSLFEYITGITIGSLAAYISLDLESEWHLGLVSLIVWSGVSFGIEWLQLKSKRVRDFVDSRATVLIRNGKVLEDNLKKERLTADELMEQLRLKSAFKIADVEFAIMETSGEINVLLKDEHQPITLKDLGKRPRAQREPLVVISDGDVLDDALATAGKNRKWLTVQLEKKGLRQEQVYLAQVDGSGKIHFDLYDDKLDKPKPDVKN